MSTLYEAVFPLELRMLRNLDAIFDKAIAHAGEQGADIQDFLDTRLVSDMHSLIGQVQFATDSAKGCAARLAGVQAPSFPDVETTMPELKERLAKTIAFLESITPEQTAGDEGRTIEVKLPSRTLSFTARDFVYKFALPNFMFHVVTAYGILRHRGVPIGKMDFLNFSNG